MPKRREELARSVLPDRARTARAGSPRPRDRASLRGPGHRGNARGRPRRTAGTSPRAAAPPARTASARLAVRSASRARCARLRAPGERRAGTDRRGRPGRAAPRRPRLRGPSANESVFGGGTPVGAPVAPAALLPRQFARVCRHLPRAGATRTSAARRPQRAAGRRPSGANRSRRGHPRSAHRNRWMRPPWCLEWLSTDRPTAPLRRLRAARHAPDGRGDEDRRLCGARSPRATAARPPRRRGDGPRGRPKPPPASPGPHPRYRRAGPADGGS
jgi:hypothetical protein